MGKKFIEITENDIEFVVMNFFRREFDVLKVPYTLEQYGALDEQTQNEINDKYKLRQENLKELKECLYNDIVSLNIEDIDDNKTYIEELFKSLIDLSFFNIEVEGE